jgi:hypothetical protein
VLKVFFISIVFSGSSVCAQLLPPPVGLWREHLPYNSAIDAAAGENKIYCATPYSLFTVDTRNKQVERLSRVTGLSETGISAIHYDAAHSKLVIAYSNSNIDIVFRNDIYNVPDIKRSNIAGNKNIYNIFSWGKDYFLSTGLGVIVVNGEKYEIKDSWFIGQGGSYVKVNGFTGDAQFFYAATDEGLKKVSIHSTNPADYRNWELVSGTGGLFPGPCHNVLNVQNKIVVQKADSLFAWNGSHWNLLWADAWNIVSVNASEDKLLICQRNTAGSGRVVILNTDGSVNQEISQSGAVSFPQKAILSKGQPWIADLYNGLSHVSGSSYIQYKPDSPEATASGEMAVYNNVFYATAGEVNDAWNYQYNGNGIFMLKDGAWHNINRYRFPQIDTLLDFICIAIDPADASIWAGSFGGGLLHIKEGPQFEIFKQNSAIGQAVGDPGSYRIAGLSFDKEKNLWISNFGAAQPLVVRKKDGTWKNFTIPFLVNENAVAQIVIDDNNYKWILSPLGNGLICYDHGAGIDNTGDDRWKIYRAGTGNGNLPSNNVFSIAKDKNGIIWAGTDNGMAVFQCPQNVFTANGCEALWPVVPQGNFAGYLFRGQQVRSIAVDGADRKWVATPQGVFLISPEGEKVIYHFTEENSPLLSSDVRKIAIDGKTGEVFFATLKGICSFRSTATEGGIKNENVLVFPNPVPPGFTGSIAIRGLVNNAIVKIAEPNGRLVFQTRALGGQAIWDGRDYMGRKISSGVYLVLVSDDERKENTAAKIVFISRN